MDINKLTNYLVCANCKGDLEESSSGLKCLSCGEISKTANGKIYFEGYERVRKESESGTLDLLKKKFKKFPRLYDFLVRTVSPVLFQKFIHQWPLKISNTLGESEIRLNLGAGNNAPWKNFINIDGVPYENVSIVCDIARMPFRDKSVSLVVLTAVLEHVKNDRIVISEVSRVLRSGGVVCCAYPFVQGFHASPYDYGRRTNVGLKELFEGYEIVELWPYGGPTSGFLWVFQEWLAIFSRWV